MKQAERIMTIEVGTVLQVRPGRAKLQLERTTACASCKSCLIGKGARYMVSEAGDPVGVAVGDLVRVEVPEARGSTSPVTAGFLLFILPLLLFAAGYFTGSALAGALRLEGSREALGILGSFLFLPIPYLVLFLRSRRGGGRPVLQILDVLKRSGPAGLGGNSKTPIRSGHR
jgi:sigma-E factor negative regulatory protein RseC